MVERGIGVAVVVLALFGPQITAAQSSKELRWRSAPSVPGLGPSVWDVAECRSDSRVLWAASDAGPLVSRDAGRSFARRALPGDGPPAAQEIDVSPDDPDLVLVLQADRVLRSTDGGRHWQVVIESAAGPVSFAPSDGSVAYVGGWRNFLVSHDGGRTFEPRSLAGAAHHLVVDPTDPLHVDAFRDDVFFGVHVSTQDGFVTLEDGQELDLSVAGASVDPRDPDHLLSSLQQSFDRGRSWAGPKLSGSRSRASAIDPRNGRLWTAFAEREPFAGDFLLFSDDGGLTFLPSADPVVRREVGPVGSVLPSSVHSSRLLLGAQTGVFRSRDRGDSFENANAGLESLSSLDHLALSPFDADRRIVLAGGTVRWTLDAGARWRISKLPPGVHARVVRAVPTTPDRWYLASARGRLLRSDDAGRSFQEIAVRGPVWEVWPHPSVPDRLDVLWIEAGRSALARSLDGGSTFQAIATPDRPTAFALSPVAPHRTYLTCFSGSTWYSTDDASTWRASQGSSGTFLLCDPIHPHWAYAADGLGALSSTVDGGRHWQSHWHDQLSPTHLAVAPSMPGVIFCLDPRNHRIWRSDDLGQTLQPFGLDYPRTDPTSLVDHDGTILLTTHGSGILELR